MAPMYDASGRDISRDLDNYITGHYGEDDPANADPVECLPPGVTPEADEDGELVFACNSCGAYALTPEDIRHYPGCKDREAPYWKGRYKSLDPGDEEDEEEFLLEDDCSD